MEAQPEQLDLGLIQKEASNTLNNTLKKEASQTADGLRKEENSNLDNEQALGENEKKISVAIEAKEV